MKQSGNIFWCTPDEIHIEDGFNARKDYGDIDQLAQSIIENGIKVYLKGRKETIDGKTMFVLTDGHRRFTAVKRAYEMGHTSILLPVQSDGKMNDEERVLSMIIYNDGKRLNMLEEAEVYQRLTNWGWSAPEIAKKVGKSGQFVRDCLLLMSASSLLKKQIEQGKVSGSTVVELMKKNKDTKSVERQIEKAVEKNNGGRVSTKHIASKKPTKTDLETVIVEIQDETVRNAVNSFLLYINGDISKNIFLTNIGEIQTV